MIIREARAAPTLGRRWIEDEVEITSAGGVVVKSNVRWHTCVDRLNEEHHAIWVGSDLASLHRGHARPRGRTRRSRIAHHRLGNGLDRNHNARIESSDLGDRIARESKQRIGYVGLSNAREWNRRSIDDGRVA